jgi:hypothetical protein
MNLINKEFVSTLDNLKTKIKNFKKVKLLKCNL